MPDDAAAYVERYRWTRSMMVLIGICMLCVASAVYFYLRVPPVISLLVIGSCGWAGGYSLATVLSRRVALRVDAAGVTLGGGAFRYRATTRSFPWADIEAITLWQRDLALGKVRYIGVRRRPRGAPLTTGGRGRADWPAYMAPVTGVSAGAARNITAWVLDSDRLAKAVGAFAPGIPVDTAVALRDGARPERSRRRHERVR